MAEIGRPQAGDAAAPSDEGAVDRDDAAPDAAFARECAQRRPSADFHGGAGLAVPVFSRLHVVPYRQLPVDAAPIHGEGDMYVVATSTGTRPNLLRCRARWCCMPDFARTRAHVLVHCVCVR